MGQDKSFGVFCWVQRFVITVERKYCLAVFILQAVWQLLDVSRAMLALRALLLKMFMFFYYSADTKTVKEYQQLKI